MSRAQEARDRAAQWIIAREQPEWNDTDKAALEAWLAESDMNKAAYWRLEHSWREADRIGALGRGIVSAKAERPRYRGLGWWAPVAIAASLVAVVGIGSSQLPRLIGTPETATTQRFDTPIGGRRMLELPDGSRVELNTASVVRTVLDGDRREIWLDGGEAYFEVLHNKARPFVVHAGSRQITVLGTKFSVRRDGEKVTVSVLQGRVQLDDIEDARTVRSTIITGGDVAVARGPATLVTANSEEQVEDSLAWRQGMLSFDQERLGDIAVEFNRYNSKQMIVTDPGAASIRIGGMFPASKPDAFVRLLRDAYGLEVVETPDGVRISD
jgi:transmembrane sensor